MPLQNSSSLTLDAAQQVLHRFLCVDQPEASQPFDRAIVQQALLLVVEHCDYAIFGICADTAADAAMALKTYLAALGYDDTPDVKPHSGPVYLKYNPRTRRCHLDAYTGSHRGVLVACQPAYDGDVSETFGHLPLDLFEN